VAASPETCRRKSNGFANDGQVELLKIYKASESENNDRLSDQMDMTNSQPALLTGLGFTLSPLAYCFHCHGRDFVYVEGFAERCVCNQHNGMPRT
jgi:hypothetical protein